MGEHANTPRPVDEKDSWLLVTTMGTEKRVDLRGTRNSGSDEIKNALKWLIEETRIYKDEEEAKKYWLTVPRLAIAYD